MTDLDRAVPDLHLWAAGIYDNSSNRVPPCLNRHLLDVALRAAPRLVREVAPGISQRNQKYAGQVPPYAARADVSPTDGPAVLVLRHHGAGHDTQGTTEVRQDGSVKQVSFQHQPWECRQCGRNAATAITRRVTPAAQGQLRSGAWVASEFEGSLQLA